MAILSILGKKFQGSASRLFGDDPLAGLMAIPPSRSLYASRGEHAGRSNRNKA